MDAIIHFQVFQYSLVFPVLAFVFFYAVYCGSPFRKRVLHFFKECMDGRVSVESVIKELLFLVHVISSEGDMVFKKEVKLFKKKRLSPSNSREHGKRERERRLLSSGWN